MIANPQTEPVRRWKPRPMQTGWEAWAKRVALRHLPTGSVSLIWNEDQLSANCAWCGTLIDYKTTTGPILMEKSGLICDECASACPMGRALLRVRDTFNASGKAVAR